MTTAERHRALLGKSLLLLAHNALGKGATISQMAHYASTKLGIDEDEAKRLIFEAC